MPGGKVDRVNGRPESLIATASRELTDETGVELDRFSHLFPIFSGQSRHYRTTVFAVAGSVLVPDKMQSIPFEGYARWMPPQELCTPQCTFGEFQFELFTKFGIL